MQNMRIIFLLLLSTINMSMSMDHQSYSINDLPAATKSRIIALIFCMNRLTNQELPTLCIQEIVDQIDNFFEPLSPEDQDMLLNTLDPITNTIQSPDLSAREPDSKEIAKQKEKLHEKNYFLSRLDISDELQKIPDTDKMSPKKLKQIKRTIRERIFQNSDKIDAPLRDFLHPIDIGFNNINFKYLKGQWRLCKNEEAIPAKEFESSKEIFICQMISKKYLIGTINPIGINHLIGTINSSGDTTINQPINKKLYAFDKQSCSFIPTSHKIYKDFTCSFLIKHNMFLYAYNFSPTQYAIHILNAPKYLHNKSIAELQELKQQIDKYNNNQQ